VTSQHRKIAATTIVPNRELTRAGREVVATLGLRIAGYEFSVSKLESKFESPLKSAVSPFDFLKLRQQDIEEFLGRLWVSSRTSGLNKLVLKLQLLFPNVLSTFGSATYAFFLAFPKLRPAICKVSSVGGNS
jgi:hypothetical protein